MVTPNPKYQPKVAARQRLWAQVQGSWNKAFSATKAIASSIFGQCSTDIYHERITSCHGDQGRKSLSLPLIGLSPCPHRQYSSTDKFHFCGICGCGNKNIARLDAPNSGPEDPQFNQLHDKLKFPYLDCPIGRPGFSNAGKVEPNAL